MAWNNLLSSAAMYARSLKLHVCQRPSSPLKDWGFCNNFVSTMSHCRCPGLLAEDSGDAVTNRMCSVCSLRVLESSALASAAIGRFKAYSACLLAVSTAASTCCADGGLPAPGPGMPGTGISPAKVGPVGLVAITPTGGSSEPKLSRPRPPRRN